MSAFGRKVRIRVSKLDRNICGDVMAKPSVRNTLLGSSSVDPGGRRLNTRLGKGLCIVERCTCVL